MLLNPNLNTIGLFAVLLFAAACSSAQPPINNTKKTSLDSFNIEIRLTKAINDTLYLAANINGWNPGSEAYRFKKISPLYYSIAVPVEEEGYVLSYKITRGSWNKVEVAENGQDLNNHTAVIKSGKRTTATITNWRDKIAAPKKQSTALANVTVLTDSFYIPQLERYRKIWIYLPKGYATNNKRYSVWYMHDGQNLFDEASGFNGEWGVDETLNTLQDSVGYETIVVGIAHGNDNRIAEYTPWANQEYGGGEGKAYLDFIVANLKPHIDSLYRTRPAAEFTGIMGSSLGGLISLYAAGVHPQIFGMIGVLSPSLWFNEEKIFQFVKENIKPAYQQRFYILGSEKESESMVPNMQKLYTQLLANGLATQNLKIVSSKDGAHAEWYWNREIKPVFIWFFQ